MARFDFARYTDSDLQRWIDALKADGSRHVKSGPRKGLPTLQAMRVIWAVSEELERRANAARAARLQAAMGDRDALNEIWLSYGDDAALAARDALDAAKADDAAEQVRELEATLEEVQAEAGPNAASCAFTQHTLAMIRAQIAEAKGDTEAAAIERARVEVFAATIEVKAFEWTPAEIERYRAADAKLTALIAKRTA